MARRLIRFFNRFIIPIAPFLVVIWAMKVAGAGASPAATIIGALGLALGFALQTILTNYLSGKWIRVEAYWEAGDWIRVEDNGAVLSGRIIHLGARTVQIQQVNGDVTLVPWQRLFISSVTLLGDTSVELLKSPPAVPAVA